MAKVSGPLMSLDARGKFAEALVFTAWKGRAVVRQLVQPANPRSDNQEDARNKIRVTGAAQHWAAVTSEVDSVISRLDREVLRDAAPPGQAWNGFLVKSMIGAADVNYEAAIAAWEGLESGQQTAWNTAAEGLSPPIPPVAQTLGGGDPGAPITAGQVFFMYRYGLFIADPVAYNEPGATPPTYS